MTNYDIHDKTTIDRAALIEQAAKCPCDCHHTPDEEHGHVPEECPCRPMWIRVDSVLNRALIEHGLHESRFSAGIRDSILALFATSRPVIAKALLAPLRELVSDWQANGNNRQTGVDT